MRITSYPVNTTARLIMVLLMMKQQQDLKRTEYYLPPRFKAAGVYIRSF